MVLRIRQQACKASTMSNTIAVPASPCLLQAGQAELVVCVCNVAAFLHMAIQCAVCNADKPKSALLSVTRIVLGAIQTTHNLTSTDGWCNAVMPQSALSSLTNFVIGATQTSPSWFQKSMPASTALHQVSSNICSPALSSILLDTDLMPWVAHLICLC